MKKDHSIYKTQQLHHSFLNSTSRITSYCQKQRNQYIQREVNDLIKKQLHILFATKKLEKELEDHHKDIVYTTTQTPYERVQTFRSKERQKQWEKLKIFKLKNQERMKRLAMKLKQKSESLQTKTSQNFMRMSKIHKQYEKIQESDGQRIQELKKQLLNSTPRVSTKKYSSRLCSDEKILNRVKTAKQLSMMKQSNNINSFLNKMRIVEQKNLSKEIWLQTKRVQAAKNVPKCNIAMRIEHQQQMANNWSQLFQKRIQRFESNRESLYRQKQQFLREKSQQRNLIKEQVLDRKHNAEQKMAEKRIISLQTKINKIRNAPGRNQNLMMKSHANFIHNISKLKEEKQKQRHSSLMRKVYNVIEKLKKLDENQQLDRKDIDLLLENLDPNEKNYKQIFTFLNTSKEKFLEQKQKEEEEKIKKNKKSNQKML